MVKINDLDNPLIIEDISNTRFRYFFLPIACLMCFGSYFVYNSPAALEIEIEEVIPKQRLSISYVEFNLLYSIYSFPNIFFPLIGGMLLDKFGLKFVIIASSVLVTTGHAIFSFGVSVKSYYIALIGRGIFGCGGESLDMSQGVVVIDWFIGKELSLAYSINSCTSLIADIIDDNLTPFLYTSTDSVIFPLWIGCLVCIGSLLISFVVLKLDSKRKNALKDQLEEHENKETFKISDVKRLKKPFWVLLVNITYIESAVYCFIFGASAFLQERFGYDVQTGGSVMSIIFIVTVVSSPIFGFMIDKIGKRTWFNMGGCLMVILFHVTFMIVPDQDGSILPIFIFFLLGCGYSLSISTAWASIPYVVEEKIVGTAFGLTFSVGNLNLVIFPVIIGVIQENTEQQQHGYFWVSFLLAMLGCVGFLAALWLNRYDKKNHQILDSSNPQGRLQALSNQRRTMSH